MKLHAMVPVLVVTGAAAYTAARLRPEARDRDHSALVSVLPTDPRTIGENAATVTFDRVLWMPGPASGDAGNAMAIDDDGSMFIAGRHGGLDMDRDGDVDVQADGIDPLFMKLAPDGSLLWVRSPSGAQFESAGRIALDRAGGVYGVGGFSQTLRFSNGITLTAGGGQNTWLVHYDAMGAVQWTRTILGPEHTAFRDVATDAHGNVYVTASGRGRFTLEGHNAELRATGASVQLIASYDPNGELRWVRPSSAADGWSFHNLGLDPAGDLFVGGRFSAAGVDFDGDGRLELSGSAGGNAFVAHLDSAGRFLHAWRLTASGDGWGPGDAFLTDLVLAGNGDIVLAGNLMGEVDFDDDGKPDATSRIGGDASAFLARYNRDGELRWVRSYTIDGAWDVATDGDRFLLSGFYKGDRDVNDDGVIDERDGLLDPLDKDPDSEWIALVVSENGSVEHRLSAPGPGNDQARAAAFLPDRSALYVTGFIQLTADFTGDRTQDEGMLRCDALGDLVIARYRISGCPITLAATARETEGRQYADLAWSGIPTARVEIHRNGSRIAFTANDGAWTDTIPAGNRGPVLYEVMPAERRTCTDSATITF